MRTSRRLLIQVRRALLVAFLFSGCINILMLATPLYTLQIFETVVPTGSVETLVLLSAIAAAGILSLMLIEIARDTILLRAGVWIDHTLGQHILENGLRLNAAPQDLRGDARALTQFRSFLMSPAIGSMFDAPWVPLFLVALVLVHPMLGAVATLSALLLLLAALAQGLLVGRPHGESQRAQESADQWWQTVARSSHVAGAMGLAQSAAEQWERHNRAHIASAYSLGKRSNFVRASARAVRILSQIALYGVGAYLVVGGELAPGALVASAILMSRALAPIEQAVSALRTATAAWAAYKRLRVLPGDAPAVRIADGLQSAAGHLTLTDVTFYYPHRRSPALRGVSLAIEPGECLGIVGPNGSGKSTLCGVIAGAFAPAAGSADLDGIPVLRWQRGDRAPPIGYMPDTPLLMDGSVHENIVSFRDQSLMTAAESAMRAGVHEILSALQNGYDTAILGNDAGLSLRERRAVAFARAVCGHPRILVVDEPEIGLDGASLRRLSAVFEALKAEGVSLVLATQDPRLLKVTDKVVVLNGGVVQSFGASADVGRQLAQAQRAGASGAGLH